MDKDKHYVKRFKQLAYFHVVISILCFGALCFTVNSEELSQIIIRIYFLIFLEEVLLVILIPYVDRIVNYLMESKR